MNFAEEMVVLQAGPSDGEVICLTIAKSLAQLTPFSYSSMVDDSVLLAFSSRSLHVPSLEGCLVGNEVFYI